MASMLIDVGGADIVTVPEGKIVPPEEEVMMYTGQVLTGGVLEELESAGLSPEHAPPLSAVGGIPKIRFPSGLNIAMFESGKKVDVFSHE